jgi:hypothetical protein
MVSHLAMWPVVVMLVRHGAAIAVAPGSDCGLYCTSPPSGVFLNSSAPALASSTLPTDVSCIDSDYVSTARGKRFRDCVACESTSMRVDGKSGESDLYWFLCQWN